MKINIGKHESNVILTELYKKSEIFTANTIKTDLVKQNCYETPKIISICVDGLCYSYDEVLNPYNEFENEAELQNT